MLRAALSPLRTLFAVVVVGLATLILGTYVIVLVKVRPATEQVARVMRLWAGIFLFATGTKTTVEGVENVDPSASYVFVGNHISNLDVPLVIRFLPVSIRFLAKKELFGVPVLAGAMRAVHMVETDRAAGAAAHRQINDQVSGVVDAGLSLIIFPEGTRSVSAEMTPFKKGAFRIAIDNELAVVPMTITGTHAAWKPGGKLIFGGHAQLVIHEPIPTVGMDHGDIADLRDRVWQVVAERYQVTRG